MATVTIERLGHLGDGIAPGPIYAPRVLPGEQVTGEINGDRMSAPKILQPSHHRVSALCRHYKVCGGCAVQHASDDFVSIWKADIVERALASHGLRSTIRKISTSPLSSRRRAVLSGRRTKKSATVGFHATASDIIHEIPDCRILTSSLVGALPVLKDITRIGATRKSELRLAVTDTESGIDLSVHTGRSLDMDLRQQLAAIAEQNGLARITWDNEIVAQSCEPILKIGTSPVPIPPGAFLQATSEGEAALISSVEEALGPTKSVADLFAGCGTFALSLAQMMDVHAVESDAASLHALDAGWRHSTRTKLVTTEKRDLFRRPLTPDELQRFEGVVIDPPRAGVQSQAEQLANSGIGRIAAVSCNPVTFARDAAILTKSGYRLIWVDIVDQFRWSAHVELVGAFERATT
ncbi:MAG: class I SAM-dependent RNA methyltransferase [Boseongicola sp.]|nr:MAG: class I SAM-dependent RNA methyltransferase [Boseongicola sp.]